MLALTRKKGESIIIGDNIEIVVIGVAGDSVKLGIQAPKNITVNRKEIYEQIQAENKKAVADLGFGALKIKKQPKDKAPLN